MRLITVVGARPQIIKEAMIQDELRKHPNIHHIFIHTGQHYDFKMSDVFIAELGLKKPDYFLGINQFSSPNLIGQMMIELEKVFLRHDPDLVVVYGDTDSTLAAALTAKKMDIKVAHIEAGLRQEPKSMPEEINRVLTDHISSLLFTSSQLGIENLNKEGIFNNVHLVGDIMFDIFIKYSNQFSQDVLNDYNLNTEKYILFTLHRNFNVDKEETLRNILSVMRGVNQIIKVVFPLHPRTKKMIQKYNLEYLIDNMIVLEPQNYLNLMSLVKFSSKVVTDSGGLQKEAYFSGKNAIVLMEDTGWMELINEGYNKLVDVNIDFTKDVMTFSKPIKISSIYGNGNSNTNIILKIISSINSHQ